MSVASVDTQGLQGLKKPESGRWPPSTVGLVDPPKSQRSRLSLSLESVCSKKFSGRRSE